MYAWRCDRFDPWHLCCLWLAAEETSTNTLHSHLPYTWSSQHDRVEMCEARRIKMQHAWGPERKLRMTLAPAVITFLAIKAYDWQFGKQEMKKVYGWNSGGNKVENSLAGTCAIHAATQSIFDCRRTTHFILGNNCWPQPCCHHSSSELSTAEYFNTQQTRDE